MNEINKKAAVADSSPTESCLCAKELANENQEHMPSTTSQHTGRVAMCLVLCPARWRVGRQQAGAMTLRGGTVSQDDSVGSDDPDKAAKPVGTVCKNENFLWSLLLYSPGTVSNLM